jgi:cell division septation protein DedD
MAAPEPAPVMPPQPMAAPEPALVMPPQPLPDLSAADPGFPDSIFPDFSATPPAGADQTPADAGFPDPSFVDQSVADAGVAEAPFAAQGSDASFPETNFASGPDMGHRETVSPAVDAQAQMPQPQAFAPQAPQAPQQQAAPQTETGRQLLAFDAEFTNQPPEIALGGPQAPAPAPMPVAQEQFEAQGAEADFVDESLVAPAAGRSKFASLKGRSAFMVGSALLGAIALGGALAFAYKESGGGMGSEQPPVVTADASPVKAAPANPGGKEFPHKNKLIYDRLTNGDVAESERLVPRQENVAVPAMPPATATAGLPAPVASTDLTNPAAAAAGEDGGPRKVKTMVVRPDGSVEASPAAAAAAAAVQTAAAPAAAAVAAATPPAATMPVPAAPITPPAAAAAAAPQQAAAVAPKPAPTPPAANTKYVVQVGSKKSQTEALAAFADIQQKHPSLLGTYRPIVQKANLGAKGTWYRLRVGPIDNKAKAYKLCGDLKSQGLPDCLVMTQ